jgi:hypothetical protein
MMDRMREATQTHFEQMEIDGKKLSDIKDKANIPRKIAVRMQDNQIEGWAGMKFYHIIGTEYTLFKSL